MIHPVQSNLVYKKRHKGRIKGYCTSKRSSQLIIGFAGLRTLQNGRLTYNQLESLRKTIVQLSGRKLRVWFRLSLNEPVTAKPKEVRMGKGKGNVDRWVCRVRSGKVIVEVLGGPKHVINSVLSRASTKLPVGTSVIYRH